MANLTLILPGLSERKKVFDVTVAAGDNVTLTPTSVHFQIVASAPGAAGTYNIEHALTAELADFRPTMNSEAVANTALSNGGTIAARTTVIAPPGVQQIRLTAITSPTRFIAYGD